MTSEIYLAIAISAAVTLALRVMPILLLSRFKMPQKARDWLDFIPGSIMAAIIASELIHKPEFTQSGISVSWLAALTATSVGIASRNLFLTVIAGVAAFLTIQALLAG